VNPGTLARRASLDRLDWLAVGLLVALAGLYLAWLAGASTAFSFWLPDDWTMFAERADPSPAAYLAPFNGHWSAIQVVAYQVMLRLFGLGSYGPWLALATILHLVCVGLVFVVVRRAAGPIVAAAAGAALLLFSQGVEGMWWPFELGFLVALAAGLASMLLIGGEAWSAGRAVAVVAMMTLAVASSGVGVVMLVPVAVLGWPRRLAVLIPPVAVYALWWLAWPSAFGRAPGGNPVEYGLALLRILGELAVGPASVGLPLALVGVAAAVVALVLGWRPTRWTVAALAGLAALYGSIGLRGGWDPATAEPSRYRYVAMALFLVAGGGVAGQAIAAVERRWPSGAAPAIARAAIVALFVVPVVTGLAGFDGRQRNWQHWSLVFQAQERAVASLGANARRDARFEANRVPVSVYRSVVDRWGPRRYGDEVLRLLEQPLYVRATERMLAQAAPS
jgi:hypothetical protein